MTPNCNIAHMADSDSVRNFTLQNCCFLNYLNIKTLYSRQYLDALFLVNVRKNKINCSVGNTVGLHVPPRQLRHFSTFNVSNVSRLSCLARCVTAAKRTCRSLDILINTLSPLRVLFCFF